MGKVRPQIFLMTAVLGTVLIVMYKVFRKPTSSELDPTPSEVENYGTPVAFI